MRRHRHRAAAGAALALVALGFAAPATLAGPAAADDAPAEPGVIVEAEPGATWLEAAPTDGHLPVYADETYTLTLVALDQAGRPEAGVPVTFQAAPGVAITPSSCVTAADGRCSVTLSAGSAGPGTYGVTATVDGGPISGTRLWPTAETVGGTLYEAPDAPLLKFWPTPATPSPIDLAALLQQILDLLRAFVANLLSLFPTA
ncbi:MAG: Ig-like domain-containing protein [Propionibacteriaceae bacterium]|jgi:hypothetical protein|nr:Ig-like domain-containing protein [Propionibacteriaceae bacterium]